MITVSLEGQEAVFAKFKELDDKLSKRAVRKLADAVYKDVQQGADKHTNTGALFRSVRIRSVDDGYEIFHDLQHAPYAPFVHWGSKPHVIRPKNKKALRWPSGNGFVFAKFVHHPGYIGDEYMVRAAAEAPSHLETIIKQFEV